MTGEVWKDIEGYEGLYQVSNHGRVKSLPKQMGGWYRHYEIIMKTTKSTSGYTLVSLGHNGEHLSFSVHRFVASAFIPNPLDLPCVNHKDGVKSNNHVDNLEWCTHKENIGHAIDMGLRPPNNNRKLTEEQVLEIFESTKSSSELALEYSVKMSQITGIRSGRAWSKTTGKKAIPSRVGSGLAKLDELQVAVIKQLITSQEVTIKEISRYFKLDESTFSAIKTGKTWNHVPWPNGVRPTVRKRIKQRKAS